MHGENTTVIEISAFFSNRIAKTISFSNLGITVEKAGLQMFVAAENINAFRFGTVWTRGLNFVFGRQYLIETKDFNDNVFQIKLNSIYGRRRKAYYEAWSAIFNQLWSHYFSNMLNYYIELYKIQQVFELAEIKFDADGISWGKKNRLLWNEIAIKNYRTYFMIHHINDPMQHKSCSFANDWNAFVLQCLLKKIITQQEMIRIN